MPTKKKVAKKRRLKKTNTVIIVETSIEAKDTLFPEKVAKAKEMLSKNDFNGYI